MRAEKEYSPREGFLAEGTVKASINRIGRREKPLVLKRFVFGMGRSEPGLNVWLKLKNFVVVDWFYGDFFLIR